MVVHRMHSTCENMDMYKVSILLGNVMTDLLDNLDGEERDEGLVLPLCVCCCCCFFCLALEFWNHTCVTRLDSPVICAIRSRSWPSGLLSRWKLAWSTWTWSSVNVVRTRFVLDFWLPSESGNKITTD